MKKTLMALLGASMLAGPVYAEINIPLLSYRTGPYAANGIPLADGMQDYVKLVNARDGGIGGETVVFPECETGYNTEKGVECYESTKGDGALMYMPWSTGITYQLIPRATADGIPVHSMGYGRTSAANGKVFEWVFNYPATYWDGASVAIEYLLEENGGDLSGQKIALVYHNSAFGKEPIRTLEKYAEQEGFELLLLPVDHPGQEQKSQWLQIRRERPDNVLMWGWGVMNQVAVQEAANIRYPMEDFIGIWWSGSENDVKPAGDGADGYKALSFAAPGMDFDIYDDLEEHVYSKGEGSGAEGDRGTKLYNLGLYQAMLNLEAVRTAQELAGTSDITPAQMRDGMEALQLDEARMQELGLGGFGPTFETSCANHGGSGRAAVHQWDAEAEEWTVLTDYIESDQDIVQPLIEEDSMAYADENNIELRCEG